MTDDLTAAAAFLAGLVSFFSPCVLPLLPLYLAVIAPGGGKGGRRRVFLSALCFVAGFTLVFVLLGLTASAVGGFLFEQQSILRRAGGIFMVVMGAFQAGLLPLGFLLRERRPFLSEARGGGAFVLGMAFVFGWMPCTSPLLGTILLYAGLGESVYYGGYLLAVYSAGFALPLLLAALAADGLTRRLTGQAAPWLGMLQKLSGLVLIVVGVLLYFNKLPEIISLFL